MKSSKQESNHTARAPIFPKDENLSRKDTTDIGDDLYIEKALLEELGASGSSGKDIAFETVKIYGSKLNDCRFKGLRLKDVVIDNSNFLNSDCEEAQIDRVEIKKSRLTGLKLVHARLEDVSFRENKSDFSLFRFSKLKRVCFEKCFLKDSDFQGAELEHVSFIGCDLNNVEFSHAKLKNVDLSGSQIEGIQISSDQLRGVSIDHSQMATIIGLLGIKIK